MEKGSYLIIGVLKDDSRTFNESGFNVEYDNISDNKENVRWVLEINNEKYMKEVLNKVKEILEEAKVCHRVGNIYNSLKEEGD